MNDQNDRRVPRGLGPEHRLPIPPLTELDRQDEPHEVGGWIDHDSAERIAFELAETSPRPWPSTR